MLNYLVRRRQLQGTRTSHPAGKSSVTRESTKKKTVLESEEHQKKGINHSEDETICHHY